MVDSQARALARRDTGTDAHSASVWKRRPTTQVVNDLTVASGLAQGSTAWRLMICRCGVCMPGSSSGPAAGAAAPTTSDAVVIAIGPSAPTASVSMSGLAVSEVLAAAASAAAGVSGIMADAESTPLPAALAVARCCCRSCSIASSGCVAWSSRSGMAPVAAGPCAVDVALPPGDAGVTAAHSSCCG